MPTITNAEGKSVYRKPAKPAKHRRRNPSTQRLDAATHATNTQEPRPTRWVLKPTPNALRRVAEYARIAEREAAAREAARVAEEAREAALDAKLAERAKAKIAKRHRIEEGTAMIQAVQKELDQVFDT
jgi:urease gamma subunit